MAQYRIKTKSFVNNGIREEGEIVEYEGIPGDNLEPMDKPAEKAVKAAIGANNDDIIRQHFAAEAGDPDLAPAELT